MDTGTADPFSFPLFVIAPARPAQQSSRTASETEDMKHEILEEAWRVRDRITAECGHDLIKFGVMLRGEESKYGRRLARLPIRRRSVPSEEQVPTGGPVHPPAHPGPSKPAIALREDPPPYGKGAARRRTGRQLPQLRKEKPLPPDRRP